MFVICLQNYLKVKFIVIIAVIIVIIALNRKYPQQPTPGVISPEGPKVAQNSSPMTIIEGSLRNAPW